MPWLRDHSETAFFKHPEVVQPRSKAPPSRRVNNLDVTPPLPRGDDVTSERWVPQEDAPPEAVKVRRSQRSEVAHPVVKLCMTRCKTQGVRSFLERRPSLPCVCPVFQTRSRLFGAEKPGEHAREEPRRQGASLNCVRGVAPTRSQLGTACSVFSR